MNTCRLNNLGLFILAKYRLWGYNLLLQIPGRRGRGEKSGELSGSRSLLAEGHIGKCVSSEYFLLKGSGDMKQPMSQRQKTYFDQFMEGIMTPLHTIACSLTQWSRTYCLILGGIFGSFPVQYSSVSKFMHVCLYRQVKV